MDNTVLVYLVTTVVTFLLGIVSKKCSFISNKLIPIQNLLIGIIVFIIQWIVTKEVNTALVVSGLTAGGIYDIFNNIKKIKGNG